MSGSVLLTAALAGAAVTVALARPAAARIGSTVGGPARSPRWGPGWAESAPSRPGPRRPEHRNATRRFRVTGARSPDGRRASRARRPSAGSLGRGPWSRDPEQAHGRSAAFACLLAAAALLVLLPLPVAVPAAATAAAVGPRALSRFERRDVRDRREQLVRDLPLTLDLLAACLAGGAPMPAAANAVATAVDGPAGDRLARVAGALAVGAPPGDAWSALAGPEPDRDPLGPASRALARAAEGGAPVAAAVARVADDARAETRAAGAQAARRAGVLAVAPLGLCFLPAFVLLGIVPVVLGIAGPLLAAG